MSRAALVERVTDRATSGLAVGGLSLPAWWPSLGEASSVAVELVPILSALWLVVQIVGYVRRVRRGAAE